MWAFLLSLLVGLLAAVVFAWKVKTAVESYRAPDKTAEAMLAVAGVPSDVEAVLFDLWAYATGTYVDDSVSTPRPDRDYSAFSPVAGSRAFGIEGLMITADASRAESGWRIVTGAFAINGDVTNAAILLSPDMAIERVWELDEAATFGSLVPQPHYRKFVHGYEYLDDGSFLFTFDGGVSLQRFDACGRRMWSAPGYYSHSVNADEDGRTAWTIGENEIVQLSTEDGAVLRKITVQDLADANPDIDIFQVRRLFDNDLGGNSRDTDGNWLPDPHHLNEVDPLPTALSGRFSDLGFRPGDLLISARSSNLLFVLDPATLEVKWWRMGATQRQHDPDWEADGTISVFNNRMSRDYSEIVAIDPHTMGKRVLVDGQDRDFYSRIRGKHQILPSGNVLVTSAQQGIAFEATPEGETAFEIVNFKPGDDAVNYVLSEVVWLPSDKVRVVPCSS